MKKLFLAMICAGALLAQAPQTPLKVGDMAPDFKLRSTAATQVTLSEFKGKSTVVLAFFPAAFTGGCTAEMKAYHTDLEKFEKMGAKVFGISTDNSPSQAYWAKEVLKVDVPMLSDFMKKTTADYGILAANGTASRTTFVIDKAGKIQHIEVNQAAIDHSGAATACSRLLQ